MLSVIMMSVIMLSVIMLSVIMPNVIIMSIMIPYLLPASVKKNYGIVICWCNCSSTSCY
jgi:hypothetical protein